jgi:excisionase family DNA binding protein
VSPLSSTTEPVAAPGETRPEIVVLCGSTRFGQAFRDANLRLTLDGKIVLSIGCDTKSDAELASAGMVFDQTLKDRLDELHKRKIDLADRVLMLNVATPEHPEGYVGESTRSEIAYAERLGKPIEYLLPLTPLLGTDSLLDGPVVTHIFLTPGEVAAMFRVDPKTVTRWAAAGRIRSIRTPGGHRRFRADEVRALLAAGTDES